jgi:hypothetical protein
VKDILWQRTPGIYLWMLPSLQCGDGLFAQHQAEGASYLERTDKSAAVEHSINLADCIQLLDILTGRMASVCASCGNLSFPPQGITGSHYDELWRMMSSGMLRHVALVRTDISEELSASFIKVTRIGELGTTLAHLLSPWWRRC